jgi:diguanylate cyclase (GGDEF)-like protein
MISLKKYLESTSSVQAVDKPLDASDLATLVLAAYGAALLQMGYTSMDACPGIGDGLYRQLDEHSRSLTAQLGPRQIADGDVLVRSLIQQWGQQVARHYQEKSEEVKDLLLTMVGTAEAAGARDQRAAEQIHTVTERLRAVACLEDLTEIRATIESTAAELKSSIDRISAEGKAAMDQLRTQVHTYQTKLEEAEQVALRDALTGVRNRLCVEKIIERFIKENKRFSVAIIDIDLFKQVNDQHGHLAGDQLLKQFAQEMVSACRSTDIVGRWGGDEFILVLECGTEDAQTQIERLSRWVCGSYVLEGKAGQINLAVNASMGLAEHLPEESPEKLLARADEAMYKNKSASRATH